MIQGGNQEQGNQKTTSQDLVPILLALTAGIAIGMNWPKIQKFLKPYMATLKEKGTDAYANLIRVFAEQKEAASDFMAEKKASRKSGTHKKS